MPQEMTDKQEAILRSFLLPDPKSMGAFNALMNVYPALAKKLFDNNPYMQKIVMTGLNNMNILDYPVCGRCERLAVWNKFKVVNGELQWRCTCFTEGCNHTTTNPVILRDWLADELKKRAPEGYVDIIDEAIDGIASMMVNKAMQDLFASEKKKGLIDARGNALDTNSVERAQNDTGMSLEQMEEQIKKEYEANV